MGKNVKEPEIETADGFERVFKFVGGYGRFQLRLLLIVSWQKIFLTWNHIGYAFLGTVPNHWCHIPELQTSNWTLEEIKRISIPVIKDSIGIYDQGIIEDAVKFEKCEYFDLDYEAILHTSSSFQDAYSKVDFDSVAVKKCSQWDYDKSIYKSTVATDFNLVCENRWKAATIQGSYMAGGIIGSVMFGSLSDRFLGRRRTVLTALTIAVSGTILAAFATSYWTFLFFRVIIAIGANGSMQNCFVLMTEHADKKHRALLGMLELLPFAIGYMILPGLAYCLREWWKLQLTFGLISTSLIIYYWIFPDSPRWLAVQGDSDRALLSLYRIARINGYPEPSRVELLRIVKQCHEEHERQRLEQRRKDGEGIDRGNKVVPCLKLKRWSIALLQNFKRLMETAEIRKRSITFWLLFLAVAMVYYGMVFAGNLTSDPYLVVFLGGLMEVPAYTVLVPFLTRLGRRPTTIGTFFLSGACMFGFWWTPQDHNLIRLTLAMIAKLFTTSGFAVVYLLGAELYPTELRTTGIAVGFFAGRIGAISAPYILDLMQLIFKDLPILIFGMISVLGGIIAFFLPETRTMEMRDKVLEIELHAEEEKAKERERKQSLIESLRQSLIESRRQSLIESRRQSLA